MAVLTGLNSLEVRSEIMRLLGDNCNQEITAKDVRDALLIIFSNAVGTVSPVYLKELIIDLDEMGMDLLNHSLQVTMEQGSKEIKIFDEDMGIWRVVYSELYVKELIAAANKFEGVVAENTHLQGPGVLEFNDLMTMMSTLTDAEKLLLVGHYYTWNGLDNYVVHFDDLGGMLEGAIMHTNDWIQLVNTGTDIAPVFALIHIVGDNISKTRGDGLYGLNEWANGSYEAGSNVLYHGKLYTAATAIVGGDVHPRNPDPLLNHWVERDLEHVNQITYYGSGILDNTVGTLTALNNWGMPAGTIPAGRTPYENDVYFDIKTGTTTLFILHPVDDTVQAVPMDTHIRHLEITYDGSNVMGACKDMMHNISAVGNHSYEIEIRDRAVNGSLYNFTVLISDGVDPVILSGHSQHNNNSFGDIGLYDNLGVYTLAVEFLETNVGKTYDVTVESSSGFLNALSMANGTESNDCPLVVIEPVGSGGSGSTMYTETLLPGVSGYSYIKEHKYDDGRLEYFIVTDRKKIDNYNNFVGYATYNDITFLTPFVGDVPFVSVTADSWGEVGMVWGNVIALSRTNFRPTLIGNDKDNSEGHLMCKLEGRWALL